MNVCVIKRSSCHTCEYYPLRATHLSHTSLGPWPPPATVREIPPSLSVYVTDSEGRKSNCAVFASLLILLSGFFKRGYCDTRTNLRCNGAPALLRAPSDRSHPTKELHHHCVKRVSQHSSDLSTSHPSWHLAAEESESESASDKRVQSQNPFFLPDPRNDLQELP